VIDKEEVRKIHEPKKSDRTEMANANVTRRSLSRSNSRSSSPPSRSRSREISESKRSHSRDRRSDVEQKRYERRHREDHSRGRKSYHSRERSSSRSDSDARNRDDRRDEMSPKQDERRRGRKRSRTRKEEEEENRPLDGQAQTYPKKKKEYKATSSYIGDDEFEDILERGWFYVDSNNDKQGPFTTKEMKEWFVAGFFNSELLVKRVSDPNFQKISEREEFKQLERKPSIQTYAPTNTFESHIEPESSQNPYYQDFPAFYDPSYEPDPASQDTQNEDPTNYVQAAFFTTLKGRFSAGDQASHWKKKGLPTDKDGRMLSHYFDVEAYQEQMRNCGPPKKKKVTKNMIKYYKKRKEDRKRRRALML